MGNELAIVKKVLIGKDVAVGSPANALALTAGAIAVYDNSNTLITGATSLDLTDRLVIVQGTGSTDVNGLQMGTIIGKYVTGWAGISYAAATKRIVSIGYDATAGTGSIEVNNNRTYSVIVKNETDPDNINTIDRYYYQTPLSGATQTSIAQGIAWEIYINNSGNSKTQLAQPIIVGDGSGGAGTVTINGVSFVTSNMTAPTNVGIKLTALKNNETFNASIVEDNQLYGSFGLDTTTVTSYAPGYSTASGTDIYSLEQDNLGYRGHVNRVWFPFTPEVFADKTVNYNLYVVSMEEEAKHGISEGHNPSEVIIAVPTTVTLWSKVTFETIMNSYMQSLGKGFAPVNL